MADVSNNLLVNNYQVPSWAGKPPPGLHLDVMKEGKMVQKLMIDEKRCYFFGRNKQLCDFTIDHASCSRVHAALMWHKHLNRPFLVDLGSTHGTHLGHIRLENKKPQQVPLDSEIHFGASTRKYIIRERPQPAVHAYDEKTEMEGGLLGLPETETELDNLTEFNTAHNRRIALMGDIPDVPTNPLRKRKRTYNVQFKDEEEIINPEDIDPSVGRFRNLVQTTVIPTKKPRLDTGPKPPTMTEAITKKLQNFSYIAHPYSEELSHGAAASMSVANKLGLHLPNLAPDVDHEEPVEVAAPHKLPTGFVVQENAPQQDPNEPKKKKYAKEAWPGKKPTLGLLV